MEEEPVAERDYVIIRGRRLGMDGLVNNEFVRQSGQLHQMFQRNDPFPHVVIDRLFSEPLLDLVHEEFAIARRDDWVRYDSADEVKRGLARHAELGSATKTYVDAIHSRTFVQFLERVTGIRGLLPDPELFGGGLHEIPHGGRFSIHTDFNRHPVSGLDNRLVLITYLNRRWEASYGGELELWDAATKTKVKSIVPIFGRTVLFAQAPDALHGHPIPVHAPDRRARRSIAAYFYSNGRPDGTPESITGTRIADVGTRGPGVLVRRSIKYFTPPAVLDLARSVVRSVTSR